MTQFQEIHAYTALSLLQTPRSKQYGFCGLRSIVDSNDTANVSLLLETKCKKIHKLVHYKDKVFLVNDRNVHTSYKKAHPSEETVDFVVGNYVFDTSIEVDSKLLSEEADNYLKTHGSKGLTGGGVKSWYRIPGEAQSDGEASENSDEDDDGDDVEDAEGDENDADCEDLDSTLPPKSKCIAHASYILGYMEPCDIPHKHHDGKVLFFNGIFCKRSNPKKKVKMLDGLRFGQDVQLKRYAHYTKMKRFSYSGAVVSLARGSSRRSTCRKVNTLMYV